jgi:hypothetical protein
VQQRGSGSDRTARSGAARGANEVDDVGYGSPEMVVLLCAEERQKALLRNEAAAHRCQHRQAAGAGEASAVLTPICAALRREPSAVIHTDTGRGL